MLKPFYIKKKNINNRLVPPVSAADAGKLLGVDEEGNITLVEGGGGGGGVKANFTLTPNPLQPSQSEASCDKTYQEIKEAATAGNLSASLTIIYNNQPIRAFSVLSPEIPILQDDIAKFIAFSVANSGILSVYVLEVQPDNAISVATFELDSQA